MVGLLRSGSGSGQVGYVLPSPTLAAPPLGQAPPSSEWKPGQRPPSQAEAPPDAGPACPSHCQVFTCSVCQETFRRRMELRVHMVSHTGEMPYKVRAVGQGAAPPSLPLSPLCRVVSGTSPVPASGSPAFPVHPVPPYLWARPLALWGPFTLSMEGRLGIPAGTARGLRRCVHHARARSLLASGAGPRPGVPPLHGPRVAGVVGTGCPGDCGPVS